MKIEKLVGKLFRAEKNKYPFYIETFDGSGFFRVKSSSDFDDSIWEELDKIASGVAVPVSFVAKNSSIKNRYNWATKVTLLK